MELLKVFPGLGRELSQGSNGLPQKREALSPTAQVKKKKKEKKSQAWYNPRAGEAEAGISLDKHYSTLQAPGQRDSLPS